MLMGWEIPASWFQSLNAMFIVFLGTSVALYWANRKLKGKLSTSLFKMIIGLIILGVASAGNMVMPIALLGDVIDYDIFKTQVNRSANYFSLNALLTKGNVALGGGLAFYLLAAFGYEVGSDNSQGATNGLLFVALVLPSTFSIIAGAILWFFPINRKRHAVILEVIEQRAEHEFQLD